jgi:hypothetical protein
MFALSQLFGLLGCYHFFAVYMFIFDGITPPAFSGQGVQR